MNIIKQIKKYSRLSKFRNRMNSDIYKIALKMPERHKVCYLDDLDFFVIALEDRRFLNHHGVDIFSIIRESIKAFLGGQHGGASTIDMQMVRTITGFKEKTLRRKMYEMILSIKVNRLYTKKQIIKCYLDNAYFGTGIYGCQAASHAVFRKDLSLLNVDEKAFIAAMLLKPKPLNGGWQWKARVLQRANYARLVSIAIRR